VNAEASFSVVASESVYNAFPTYQWQLSQDGGATWGDITNATSATLALTGLTTSDEGNRYRAVVTAITPVETVTLNSDSPTLSILAGSLSFSINPQDVTSDTTGNAKITSLAEESVYETTPTYQWQVSQDLGATWSDIVGETSNLLSLSSLTSLDDGKYYRVVANVTTITNETITETSNSAVLTVPDPGLIFVTHPQNQTSDVNAQASFSTLAEETVYTQDVPTYEWQKSTDGGANWSLISGQTSSVLALSGLLFSDDHNLYRSIATVVTQAGTSTKNSNPALLSILRGNLVFITQPQNTTSDVNASATISGLAEENVYNSSVNYQWQKSTNGGFTWSNIAGAIGTTLSLTGLTTSDNGNNYRILASSTTITQQTLQTTSTPVSLSVPSASLSITSQPVNTTSDANAEASFSVVASESVYSAVPTYQWQLSQDSGATWGDITNATSATLSLTGLTTSDEGNSYRVVVTAATPVETVTLTSDTATLSILSPNLAISSQPVNTTSDVNAEASFSVVASESVYNAVPTYQWQLSQDGGATWSDVTNETLATLSLTGLTISDQGNRYRVVVTAITPVETVTLTSDTVTLSILSPNLAISSQPANTTSDVNAEASFSVVASESVYSTVPTYHWQLSQDSGATWSDITNATSATLSLTGLTTSDEGNRYRAVVTAITPVETVTLTSDTVTLSILSPNLAISSQPANTTSDVNAEASFSVVASESVYSTVPTYQWQLSQDSGATWSDITNATSATLSLTGLTTSDEGNSYRVVVTAATPVETVTLTSDTATLSILSPNLAISSQPVNTTSDVNAEASFSVVASESVYNAFPTYQWQLSQDGGATWGDIANAMSATLALTGLTTSDEGNRYRVVVTAATPVETITIDSDVAVLNILAGNLTSVTQPQNETVNSSGQATFTFLAEENVYNSAVIYEWQFSQDGGNNWTSIENELSSSLVLADLSTSDNGNIYRAIASTTTITNEYLTVTSAQATLTVPSPNLVISTQPQDDISDINAEAVFFVLASENTYNTQLLYQWEVSEDSGASWTPIVGETSLNLALTGVVLDDDQKRYRVVITAETPVETVSLTSVSVILSVPAPNIDITTQPQDTSSSQGDATFTVSAEETVYLATALYQWQISQDSGSTWSDIANETSTTLSLSGLTTSDNDKMYRVAITANTLVANVTVYTNEVTLTVDFTYNQGATYSTGAGNFGQLGHGDDSSLALLEPISSTSQFLDYGQLYSTGSDVFGQLGVNSSYGSATSGQIYSAGSDVQGQLGDG
jgi:hypothetical protein